MPIVTLDTLKSNLSSGSCLLGLDLGSKSIGLAVADPSGVIASPLDVIWRRKFSQDAEVLIKIIEDRQVGGLVIGLPLNMDGREGPRCQSTRQFAENFLKKRSLPITFWDERLSSVAVERILIGEIDMTRKRRREVVDKMAAAYILQGALDAVSGNAFE